MKYKKRRRYKYSLYGELFYDTGLKGDKGYNGSYLSLSPNGQLRIKHGYCWDGPSGPAIDSRNFMRGSLIHDALYQLIREGVLCNTDRKRADRILREVCLQDGMSKLRAWWVYRGVRTGGASAVKPDLLFAP